MDGSKGHQKTAAGDFSQGIMLCVFEKRISECCMTLITKNQVQRGIRLSSWLLISTQFNHFTSEYLYVCF